jgi:hypothetical protein
MPSLAPQRSRRAAAAKAALARRAGRRMIEIRIELLDAIEGGSIARISRRG